MAIAVRAVGAVAASINAVSPGLPAGTAVGDILVMFVETNNETITAAGWTQATNSPQSDATDVTRLTVLWRRATGTDATTTSDSGDHQIARIIGFSGCVTTGDPWNITAGGTETTSDTSGSIPGATTTTANTMVVAACSTGVDGNSTAIFSAWTNASLVSITEQIDNGTNAGAGGGIGAATGIKSAAGAYSATTVTYSGASRKGLWSGALTPAPQVVTANLLTRTPTLYSATTVTARASITANLLTEAHSLPTATSVNNTAATQSITANLLTKSHTFYGGVVATQFQISANVLTQTHTLYPASNVSISILAAALLTNTTLFPAANILPSNTVTANLLTQSHTLYTATSFSVPNAVISADLLGAGVSLVRAIVIDESLVVASYSIYNKLGFGVPWYLDDANVVLDGYLYNGVAILEARHEGPTVDGLAPGQHTNDAPPRGNFRRPRPHQVWKR